MLVVTGTRDAEAERPERQVGPDAVAEPRGEEGAAGDDDQEPVDRVLVEPPGDASGSLDRAVGEHQDADEDQRSADGDRDGDQGAGRQREGSRTASRPRRARR